MKQWNQIFKKHGKVFTKVQEDIPKVARILRKHRAEKVLDLGCGSGRHTVYLAGKGFRVYGFDVAEEGIKITKKCLKEKKLKADFKTGSIYKELPYKKDFFDAVISVQTINHAKIEDIRKLICEIERILKPKGLIFITVRKRKFKKSYKKGAVIEKYGKQKSKYKMLDSRTYVPMEGWEKGLVHFLFNKEIIKKEFENFEIYNIWPSADKRHYCFLGRLK